MKTSVDDILKQEYDKSIQDIDHIGLWNLCETSEEENEVDQFKESEKRVEKFTETLFTISKTDQNSNSLTSAILFYIRYILENKTDVRYVNNLQLSINNNFLFDKLYKNEKLELVLDYQKFNANCHEINSLLAKNGYFLRIFELRKKFRYLSLKNPKKQTIVRQLSSCINEKYNGFHMISIEYSKKLRKKFELIDIIYKPVKSVDDYFKVIKKFMQRQWKISHKFAFECYYCRKFFARTDKQKRHIENCSGVPGIIYNFNSI